MGVIRKINERELVGGELDRDVYPVTSTSAVFDKNNKSLDLILLDIGLGGDIPLASRNVIVFRSSTTIPTPPLGGSWDIITNEITLPYGWSTDDLLDPPIWMSTGEFLAIAPDNPTWSTPILISGEDGKDGADGVNIEFIFKLTENDLVKPSDPLNSPLTEFIPEGWTDSPSGISDELLAEWMCMRKLNPDGSWDNWSSPALWSKWGVNGKDGDGVEYIYLVNQGEILKNPTPDNINSDEYQETGKFEGVEYVPTHLGWSDNPEGVTPKKTHEWVCVRKRKDGKWGRFSNPTLWAKWGEQGNGGISLRTMYAKTEGSDVPPIVVPDNINPGSIWGLAFPAYKGSEAVWSIQAYVTYDGKLAEVEDNEGLKVFGWQGPWICTGANGKDATPFDYKTYVYKKLDTKPAKPIYNDPKNPGGGWVDFPDSEGQWWQCVGDVLGATGLIKENGWGEVIPLNGKDGIAKDGKFTEFRFAKNQSEDPPYLNVSERFPIGWSIDPPAITSDENLFMTSASVKPDGKELDSNWSNPVKINGERGPKGETGPAGQQGPNGIEGIPGVDFETRYCLGTLYNVKSGVSTNPNSSLSGWEINVPTVTSSYPYIWCTLGRKVYSTLVDYTITWSNPFKLSGTNGIDGIDGKDGQDGSDGSTGPRGEKGQLIYPAGIYSGSTTYKADKDAAPYVFDTSLGRFYVLNVINQDITGKSPSSYPLYWTPFQQFEAIYADIGVFKLALVGSAVFSGDFVFSQLGKGEYLNFGKPDSSNPMNPNNLFVPNVCFDFKAGEAWFARGKVNFSYDGSGQLADGNIKWNTTGNIECKGTIKADKGYIGDLNIEEGKSLSYTEGSRKMNLDSAGLYFSNSSNGSSCRLDSNGLFVNNGYGINLGEGGEILGLKVSVATSPSSWGLGPFFGGTGNAGFLINSSGSLHTYNILGNAPIIGGSYPSFPKSAGRILFVKNVRGGIRLNGRLRRWDNEMNEDGFTFSDTKPRIFIFDGYAWNEFRCP